MKLVFRVLINALAIWLTAWILPNFELTGNIVGILIVAVIFGLVNALVKPIVKFFSLPLNIATLGLFTLVNNTIMLLLTAFLAGDMLTIGGGIIEKELLAFVASVIISIISTVLNWFLPDD